MNTLISHSRASSVRDIKVFTKKRKEDEVGKVKSIKVEDRSEKEYDEDKLKDVNDTFDMLDVDMTVDKCYEVDLDVKIKGSTDESDGEIIYTVIKTGGKWYLVDYDLYVY